jgi:hypothetical protein
LVGHLSQHPGDDNRASCPDAPRSAESLEERVERAPTLLVVAAAVVAFVVSVANFALGNINLGVNAASIGLLVVGGGLSWLAMERRRVRQAERDWPPNGAARS